MMKDFNHIVVMMKNPNKATSIARFPCLASLGSNLVISIVAKQKMQITKVLGGGCPSKLCWSKFEIVVLLFILAATFLHHLITLPMFPLDCHQL
jgi:hypothetical protein